MHSLFTMLNNPPIQGQRPQRPAKLFDMRQIRPNQTLAQGRRTRSISIKPASPAPSGPQGQRPPALMRRKPNSNWWSLTGSNRRHPACKAGALPAELRPRSASFRRKAHAQPPKQRTLKQWWAWEDLNFRPHAYQARALTN
jgi:hypothetical protein